MQHHDHVSAPQSDFPTDFERRGRCVVVQCESTLRQHALPSNSCTILSSSPCMGIHTVGTMRHTVGTDPILVVSPFMYERRKRIHCCSDEQLGLVEAFRSFQTSARRRLSTRSWQGGNNCLDVNVLAAVYL